MAQHPPRRRQQERREETQSALLASACRLFGERGYAATALEDIAADCGMTIGPIYHYYRSKKALFQSVLEQYELRILDLYRALEQMPERQGLLANWRGFLVLCQDRAFRQVVLLDGPAVLGRERWTQSLASRISVSHFTATQRELGASELEAQLVARMIVGALAEASAMLVEVDDCPELSRLAEQLVERLLTPWLSLASGGQTQGR